MPVIRPPVMNTFNYGQAVNQGTQNALNQIAVQRLPEQIQMQREAHQADQKRAQMQQAAQGLNMMMTEGRFVTDQPTYSQWANKMYQSGIVQPGQLAPEYSPENMNRYLGMAQDQMSNMTAEMKNYRFEQSLPEDKRQGFRNWKVSPQERIASTPGLTQTVGQSQATIEGMKEGSKEQSKSNIQLLMQPKIKAAVRQAETEAKARGETFTELQRAKAALPGLKEVAQKLGALSEVATYTKTGQAIDFMSKELGFGATKGATARSKIRAIVDNQVLPLLRDTFGAAFTVAEGESLRATLLDIDATPEQKRATLDAFIEQKMRNIETKGREVDVQDQGYSLEDLEFTAKKHGISVEEVKKRLGVK